MCVRWAIVGAEHECTEGAHIIFVVVVVCNRAEARHSRRRCGCRLGANAHTAAAASEAQRGRVGGAA